MDGQVIFFFAAILITGTLLFAAITITQSRPKPLDVDKYRVKWLSIEQQLKRDEVSSYHMSIFNADKLLDQALKERAVKGETMGERMKNSKKTFNNNNSVWSAHKLRNQIAHESDIQVSYEQTRHALHAFKQALKDLGAI